MPHNEETMILAAIATLRQELSERMDRRDEAMIRVEAKIDAIAVNGCSKAEDHRDVSDRVKVLELDKAKMAGVIVAASTGASAVVSVVAWAVSTFIK